MNEDFSNLELELKSLRPRRPSMQLRARLTDQLSSAGSSTVRPFPQSNRVSWRWVLWPSLAAAAMIAAVVLVRQPPLHPAAPSTASMARSTAPILSATTPALTMASVPKYKPVAAERVVIGSEEEGLITLSDGTLANRFRQVSVDTYTWRDAKTNASLKWSIPREDVRVVPASFL